MSRISLLSQTAIPKRKRKHLSPMASENDVIFYLPLRHSWSDRETLETDVVEQNLSRISLLSQVAIPKGEFKRRRVSPMASKNDVIFYLPLCHSWLDVVEQNVGHTSGAK